MESFFLSETCKYLYLVSFILTLCMAFKFVATITVLFVHQLSDSIEIIIVIFLTTNIVIGIIRYYRDISPTSTISPPLKVLRRSM